MKTTFGGSLVCLVAMTASLLTATAGTAGAVDAEPGPTVPSSTPDAPPVARGLIVKTTTAAPSSALLRSADNALGARGDVTDTARIAPKVSAIDFSDVVERVDADAVARVVARRSDVVWAVPNTRRTTADHPPAVAKDDELFAFQRSVWDDREADDVGVDDFPVGGYSVKAPELWRATEGSDDVVVAVLDTGITEHPDLDGQIVAGYDFIHDDGARTSNDGDGWDDDPSDPGDWTEDDECAVGAFGTGSSWHGTKVAGVIAAAADNGIGVAGIAPQVKVQPVRVVGVCGGWDSDILAGITWASGGSVDGVPVNPTPAKVVNISLGGAAATPAQAAASCEPYAEAIAGARSRGAVVVAAAGNDIGDADLAVPASCPGAVSVAATGEKGGLAWYSNIGASVDLSAPGGNDLVDDEGGIWTTWNTGFQGPEDPDYATDLGTSMAVPAVAAGAALIGSLGDFTATEVETALEAATQPFPYRDEFAEYEVPFVGVLRDLNCTTDTCGSGILDLSRVPAPISGPTLTGEPAIGSTLTADPGTWAGSPASYTYQWLRDGAPIAGADATTYDVATTDIGTEIAVRVTAVKTGFPAISGTSDSVVGDDDAPAGPSKTVLSAASRSTYGSDLKLKVTVVGAKTGDVEIREGSTVLARTSLTKGKATVVLTGTALPVGKHTVRAHYLGDAASPSVSRPATVRIVAARSSLKVDAPGSVSTSQRAQIKVKVKAKGVERPTGVVTVLDGWRILGIYRLTASDKGTLGITLPKLAPRGRHTLRIVYTGDRNVIGSLAPKVTIKVT